MHLGSSGSARKQCLEAGGGTTQARYQSTRAHTNETAENINLRMREHGCAQREHARAFGEHACRAVCARGKNMCVVACKCTCEHHGTKNLLHVTGHVHYRIWSE